jgi:hypothetical protein
LISSIAICNAWCWATALGAQATPSLDMISPILTSLPFRLSLALAAILGVAAAARKYGTANLSHMTSVGHVRLVGQPSGGHARDLLTCAGETCAG